MWEHEPLLASHHFQERITPPHETDIVVVIILWSRLGLPLPHDKFPGSLSMKGVTGKEWEFEDALKSHRERNQPDILLYRKQADVTGSLNDRRRSIDACSRCSRSGTFSSGGLSTLATKLPQRLAGHFTTLRGLKKC